MSRKKASGPPDPPWPRPPHPRRVPRQDRSRFLVDVIRTAALRVLRGEGMDALTTNRIASVAGVAVASVYQYFPNKEAILASVYEELTREEVEARTEWVERARSGSLDELIRGIIVQGIEWQRELRSLAPEFFQRFHREYALTTVVGGAQRDASRSVDWMRSVLTERRDEVSADLEVAAFMLTRGVASVIGTAIDERPELLEDGRLGEVLSAMLIRYVKGSQGS
jgi:AcrR family transcriptional regulator